MKERIEKDQLNQISGGCGVVNRIIGDPHAAGKMSIWLQSEPIRPGVSHIGSARYAGNKSRCMVNDPDLIGEGVW